MKSKPKTKIKDLIKHAKALKPTKPEPLSVVFLEHACGETVLMREYASECRYAAAAAAGERREVWSRCALIAKERGL